jgi:iron complex outermembrane receptor protein
LGFEYKSDHFSFGSSPFLNYFTNYIYLNPTSEHERLYGNGNQVYNYTQSEVLRYGAEVSIVYQPIPEFELGVVGEHVFSQQLSGEKKGFTLPFSPPPSAIFSTKWKQQKWLFMEDTYLSVDMRVTAAQNKIVPPEEPTAGYHLFNLSVGSDVVFKRQRITITAQVQNLFNKKYFNHTSYYRLINVPEAGRNIILNVSIPFSGKFKKNKITN